MRNKLMILSVVALLLPVMPALACFPDAEEEKVLFQTEHRGRTSTTISTENCQANGLNPGSYFDDKGRIVGSPCDPVEYCSDRSSTDIAVIDYCSDSWNEQQQKQQQKQPRDPTDIDICKETPTFPTCYEDAFAPTPEPLPAEDCSHEGLGLDVCRPIEEDNHEDEEPEGSEDEPTIEDEDKEEETSE